MTTRDHSASTGLLVARVEERMLAPLRRNPRAMRRSAATLALTLLVHAVVLALFLRHDRSTEVPAQKEPVSVEVVVVPPKPVPKPQQISQAQKPQPRQELEKPASSAPRAPNDTKIQTAETQKETRAPKAARLPEEGKPEPTTEASSPSDDQAKPEKADEAATKPDVLQKDAEALDKARDRPKEKPKKLAKWKPKEKTRRNVTALQQLAGASTLPDYSFARPTKKSPVYGGTEDSRYLAIVYGMIMQNRRLVDVPGGVEGNVTIAFNVDDEGNVVSMGVQHTSGYPEIDAAAAAAIRRASPFPPPPAGAPHGLIATIDFGDGEPAYTMGSRGR